MSMQPGSIDADGLARTTDGKLYVTLGSGSTIDSPTFTGNISNASRVGWAIPFVKAPSGTMANNGAVTLGTATSRIYAKCFMWFPAGAVAAGVPAAASWLYTEMSSTTVGIVYNNTYTSGVPAFPASKTAFSTTGPGAFTGDTTEVNGPTFNIGAGAMGANGEVTIYALWSENSSANNKIKKVKFGGTIYDSAQTSTVLTYGGEVTIANTGATNSQVARAISGTQAGGLGTSATAATTSNADTTAAVPVLFTFTTGVAATDWIALEIVNTDLCYRA